MAHILSMLTKSGGNVALFSMKELLERGVHFGHQARRWNPKMKQFLYTERNGIHIINLQATVEKTETAIKFIHSVITAGAKALFVGTKKQAQHVIQREAQRCGAFFVTHRWLGGMLTNFDIIKKQIQYMKRLEKMETDGTFDSMFQKETIKLQKKKIKLQKVFQGIREMTRCPDLLFVVDTIKESIAIKEAKILKIPVVAIVDSNSDPEPVDYPMPGNDDAIRSIEFFTTIVTDAIVDAENEHGRNLNSMAEDLQPQTQELNVTEESQGKTENQEEEESSESQIHSQKPKD